MMQKSFKKIVLILSLVLFSVALGIFFWCSPRSITKVPYRIKRPGHYQLAQDFFGKENCLIEIKANQVTLDLQGHTLNGRGSWDHVQSGICAQDIQDVQIENGRLNGFTYGILIQDTTSKGLPQKTRNIAIHNLRLTNNTFRGLKIAGTHSKIYNNKIKRTGGFRKFKNGFSFGIETFGSHFDIRNNLIKDTFPIGTGEGVGICLSDYCHHCRIIGNTIENRERPVFGRTFGLWVNSSQPLKNIEVSNNRFINTVHGFNEIYKNKTDYVQSHSRFKNNIFDHVACTPNDKLHPYKILIDDIVRSNTYIGAEEACADTAAYYQARFSLNLPEVQYRLGQMANTMDESILWYRKAAAQGHSEAKRILSLLEK